ncbi:---NA--- : : Sigma70_r4 [Gemmataceae bacterium]|nr:---NA--- : : Sigma70_r4 [Gemmataceae bacterium]VTU02766.1 ---NA--- : : Sigma70_r4 [Gemmataceae bacterium]
MVARKDSFGGVPIAQVRAALAVTRLHPDAGGVVWPVAVWDRLWVRLTPTQQHVVYLRFVVGLTSTAAAEQLGLSRGSVDGAVARALERIRDVVPASN